MSRTSVVTGSTSGLSRAASELLIERGNRVTGVDIHDADVVVDLSAREGRADLVSKVCGKSGPVESDLWHHQARALEMDSSQRG